MTWKPIRKTSAPATSVADVPLDANAPITDDIARKRAEAAKTAPYIDINLGGDNYLPITNSPANPTASLPEIGAAISRYGIPIGVGVATGGLGFFQSLLISASAAGGGEYIARQFEKLATSPEVEAEWQKIKSNDDINAALTSGGIDALFTAGLGTMGLIGRKTLGGMIKMSSSPKVQAAAKYFTEKTNKAAEVALKEYEKFAEIVKDSSLDDAIRSFKFSDPPIFPAFRNFTDSSLVEFFAKMADTGMGAAGVMKKNLDITSKMVSDDIREYFSLALAQKTNTQIAAIVNSVVGADEGSAMLHPINTFTSDILNYFESELGRLGNNTIDGTKLRAKLQSGLNSEAQKIYDSIYGKLSVIDELNLPALTSSAESTTSKKVITRSSGSSFSDDVFDTTRVDLLKKKPKPTKTKIGVTEQAENVTRASKITNQTTINLLEDTEEKLASKWASLTPLQVNRIIKELNGSFTKETAGYLRALRNTVEPEYLKVIEDAGLSELHQIKNSLFSNMRHEFFEKPLIAELQNVLKKNPETVASYLGLKNFINVDAIYGKLISLENTLDFGGDVLHEAPEIAEKFGIPKPIARTNLTSTKATSEWFESNILTPIRHRLITKFEKDGVLQADAALDFFNKNSHSPEFFHLIFGGQKQFDNVKELFSILSLLQQKHGNSVFIQMMQAGKLAAGGTAAASLLTDNIEIKQNLLLGATTFFIAPYLLAKGLTNQPLTRQLINGFKDGPKSPTLMTALRRLSQQKYVEGQYREGSPGVDWIDFYSSIGDDSEE